jgi:hypothetical protein
MALTNSFTLGWNSGSSSIQKKYDITSGAQIEIDETFASGSDQLMAFALDVSQLKGIFIVSDKTMTLETNSGGSPANTITLVANVPFLWTVGGAPLRDTAGVAVTVDITALYVTCGSTAVLQIRGIYDPTV